VTAGRALRGAIGLLTAGWVVLGWRTHEAKGTLGTALPPFVMGWLPKLDVTGVAVALIALVATVWLAPRLLDRRLPAPGFALASYLLCAGLGLAVNVARQGTDGWYRMFAIGPPHGFHEGPNEYLPGLPTLSYGVRFYLDRFAELIPSQSVNVAGHPPGPLLLMHALGITTAGGLAALCVVAGSLCAPLAHRIGWTLHDEATGRIAALLVAFSPVAILYGVSSYDWVMAAAGAAAACLLVAGRRGWRVVGCAAFAAAALLSWALLGVGAWAVIVVGRREGWRAAVVLAAGCGLALVVLNGALALAYGYDPVAAIRATEQVYRTSISTRRPWWFWVLGSPVAWGIMLGLPTAAAGLRAVGARTTAGIGIATIVAVAALGGFTKAETERIWLFMVPLACVAAAPYVTTRRLRVVLGALAAQALVVQLLFETVW
jgi:hypothetical protein